MAVLHVHEGEARPLRQHGRAHEIVHQAVELVVTQDLHPAREAPVEQWVIPGGQGLRAVPGGRPRVAARVGELQADDEAVVRAAALAMGGHQLLAQPRDLFPGCVADHELRGVAAPVVTHGRRLAAPDELRPARAEPPPAPPRQLARRALGRAVPALHGQDAEAIRHPQAVLLERPAEGRRARRRQRLVEGQSGTTRLQVPAEGRSRPQGSDPREARIHGAPLYVRPGLPHPSGKIEVEVRSIAIPLDARPPPTAGRSLRIRGERHRRRNR